MSVQSPTSTGVTIGPLTEADLPAADHLMRLAFGTFLGLPEPTDFMGDAGYVRTRWTANPDAAFAAHRDGELIGSTFATRWGSVGYFGPLTVHPDSWDTGVGSALMEPVLGLFERWQLGHAGLFTFPQSDKHVGLYQKFGFWPRFLTAVMARPLAAPGGAVSSAGLGPAVYSALPAGERQGCLDACREVTGGIFPGFDLESEIRATDAQGLGDTVLLRQDGALAGLAVCHCGPGTEAGGDTCFVKVGAVRSGEGAAARFTRLLDACAALATSRGLSTMTAGVNLARHEAYRALLESGYRTVLQGVQMTRDNEPGYSREGAYLLDDWR